MELTRRTALEPVTITASDKEVTYAASSVKTAPTAKTLTYNGQLQQLIKAGEADGGEMKYAVTNENKEPEADAYNFDNTSIPAAANAGTYYVWYKVKGDSNHTDFSADKPVEVKIQPKSIAGATVTLSETQFKYDTKEHSVTVSGVKLTDGTALAAGDYDVSGTKSASAKGNYTVTVTGKGNYKDTADAYWSIGMAVPVIKTVPTASAITEGQKLSDSTLSNGAADTDGTFAWKAPTVQPAASDSNKTEYEVLFTPKDTENYSTTTCKVKLTVNKVEKPGKTGTKETKETKETKKKAAKPIVIATQKDVKEHSITFVWSKVKEATSFEVWGARCGKNAKKLKTFKGRSFTHKKLKPGKYYKYQVIAKKGNKVLAKSPWIHIATKGGKNGNTQSVKLSKSSLNLKVKKTGKLSATLVNGKARVSEHCSKIRWMTSNANVASVKNGTVKAVGKGTANIYAVAQNGKYAKCTVTVR